MKNRCCFELLELVLWHVATSKSSEPREQRRVVRGSAILEQSWRYQVLQSCRTFISFTTITLIVMFSSCTRVDAINDHLRTASMVQNATQATFA